MSLLGPASTRNEPALTVTVVRPPGKYSLPVMPVRTSAAARLNVLWPETYPGNDGVTNVGSWYGTHAVPRIHETGETWAFGSAGLPCHARIAISPSCPASALIGPPGAVACGVMTAMRFGTSGNPPLLYASWVGSLDCPRLARYRIIDIGRTLS